VIIVGVGAGLSYASLGATHHSCEDIALLRMLPHMTVVCPGDAWEVRLALRAALQCEEPVYIRLGKRGEPVIHQQAPDFTLGKAIVIRPGDDVCLLSTGNMLPTVMQASDALVSKGISAQVVSFHTVKPLDDALLEDIFSRCTVVATVEEHSVLGGLGGSIAEWLADRAPHKARLCRIGTADTFLHEAGEQDYARQYFGLTPTAIAEKIMPMHVAAVAQQTVAVTA
jgi:transketolase